MTSQEIKNKIQKLNPTLTDEVLDLILKYAYAKQLENTRPLRELLDESVNYTKRNLKSCL